MARGTTPEQAAARWSQGMQGAGGAVKAGAQGVTQSPGAAAAAQVDAWVNNTMAARDRWEQSMRSLPTEYWRSRMIDVGIPRMTEAATKSKPRVQAFLSQFMPAIRAAADSLPARGSLEQNIARSAAMQRAAAAMRGQYRVRGRGGM